MSLSRYLSKLAALVGSDGKIPAAALATGATGTLSWIPCTNSNNTAPWVKLCTISGGANDRVSLLLSGTASFSAGDDTIAGGATIHMTLGNDATANNLNLNVVNSSAANVMVLGCYVVKGATDFIWDVWVQTQQYARINAFAYGNIYAISATYVDQVQTTKPTGGYDKKVGRAVTSLTAGAVLQYLTASASYTAHSNVTTSTEYLTGLSFTVTPTSASSKILLMFSMQQWLQNVNSTNYGHYTLYRGATKIYDGTNAELVNGAASETGSRWAQFITDSPGTTSPVTYTLKFVVDSPMTNLMFSRNGSPSGVTIMEIAA